MNLSQVQSQVAAALRIAYPDIEVREDDGNIAESQRDDLAGTGRTISVLPVGTVKPVSVLNGTKIEMAVTFGVGLITAPKKIGPSPKLSNPQDELTKIMATVCAVGRGMVLPVLVHRAAFGRSDARVIALYFPHSLNTRLNYNP